MTPCLAILVEHRLDRWPRTISYTDMSTVRIEQCVLKLQLRMSGILFWNTVYSETQWLQVGNIHHRSNLTSPLPTVLTLAARESPRAYVFFVSPMSGHCANIPSTKPETHNLSHVDREGHSHGQFKCLGCEVWLEYRHRYLHANYTQHNILLHYQPWQSS